MKRKNDQRMRQISLGQSAQARLINGSIFAGNLIALTLLADKQIKSKPTDYCSIVFFSFTNKHGLILTTFAYVTTIIFFAFLSVFGLASAVSHHH